jgi:flavin reductase (DIM6/NTAB) family NADH-FMN oxidoreductase RutF
MDRTGSLIKGDIRRAFTYLESGPVVLVTTHTAERDDIMSISWMMVMDYEAHIAISTGPWNESYQRILDTKECAVCVPGADLLDAAVRIGTVNGSEEDKFAANHLTRTPGEVVQAPLIDECLACLECRLETVYPDRGLLIFSTERLWENPGRSERRTFHANGDGTFFADGEFYYRRDAMKKWVPEGCERFGKKQP